VVVVAIGAALAAIVVPIVADELVANEQARAFGDCQRIAAALTSTCATRACFPPARRGDETVRFLVGAGALPTGNPFDDACCSGSPAPAPGSPTT
jgi:hypothetical protein